MIALPFHPSNAFTIKEVQKNAKELFRAVEEDAKKQIGSKVAFNLTEKYTTARSWWTKA